MDVSSFTRNIFVCLLVMGINNYVEVDNIAGANINDTTNSSNHLHPWMATIIINFLLIISLYFIIMYGASIA